MKFKKRSRFVIGSVVVGLLLAFVSVASSQDDFSKKGEVLIAQSALQCGIVPIKPIVPVQCEDLIVLWNTSPKEWEWSCVPRTRPMECGITPIKPLVPVGCSDLVPECDTRTGEWHWLCVSRSSTTTTSTTTDTTTNTTTESPTHPASQASDYQSGYVFGQALGNGILNLRIRHAINKACFDQHAQAWRLPDGTVILCTNWSEANPHDMKGIPQNISGETQASINSLCSARPKGWYKVQIAGLWYSYSCKEWRKHTKE